MLATVGQNSRSFFRDVHEGRAELDGERLLTELDACFRSEPILAEVRWRLQVLDTLALQRELVAEFETLRDELTRIFAESLDEHTVLERLRGLTHVPGREGRPLDLRRFLVGRGRLYSEPDYRKVLARKIDNTWVQVANLQATYPEAGADLRHLTRVLRGLAEKVDSAGVRTLAIKRIEDRIRGTPQFGLYEDLKQRFLRDWLARFTRLSAEAVQGLDEAEVHRLITEYRRHQVSKLLKARVHASDEDVGEHLGIHDTLEGECRNAGFWEGANAKVRHTFNEWVLRIVQGFGMLEGRRYAFFRIDIDPPVCLLAGVGLPGLPRIGEEPVHLVPFLKPFTRKAGYLLEVRQRNIGGAEEYYRTLMHYTMPFLYAFDQLEHFQVPRELRGFLNNRY